jgi:excisionase family DNA binding protein
MEQRFPAPKLLYDVEEVIQLVGIGRSKLYAYILSGQLRSLKLGRRRKIPADAIPEFIHKLQQAQE